MSTIIAAKSGNWTATDTWVGGVVPGPGDVAVSSIFVVTVNASVTCAEVRNDTTGGATAGGRFALGSGVTLTANVYGGAVAGGGVGCVALASGSGTIIGDVYPGSASHGVRNTSTGVLTIIGTVYGNGYGPGSTGITAGIYGAITTTGTLRVYRTVMGALGMPAVLGPVTYLNPRAAQNIVRATAGLTEVALRDVTGWEPSTGDVLVGTTYEGFTGVMPFAVQRQHMTSMDMSGAPFSPVFLLDELGNVLTDINGNPLIGD